MTTDYNIVMFNKYTSVKYNTPNDPNIWTLELCKHELYTFWDSI